MESQGLIPYQGGNYNLREESDRLILDNLNLVHFIVRKFVRDPTSYLYQDLYSEGTLGLVEAARRYQPRNAKFVTYAYIRIRGAILNYLKNKLPMIRKTDKLEPLVIISLTQRRDGDFSLQQVDVGEIEKDYSEIDLFESVKKIPTLNKIVLMRCEGYYKNEIGEILNLRLNIQLCKWE